MGTTLAKVHNGGAPSTSRGPFMSEWLSPSNDVLAVAHWLPTALAEVRSEYDALPPLTRTLLHTDPTPEAFIHEDGTGVTGLIDWAGSRRGPALYDIASAVMYPGGREASHQFLSYAACQRPSRRDRTRVAGPVPPAALGDPGQLLREPHRGRRPDRDRR
ncbi:phosphotransferase [Nocardioides sp. B-3]|uniref:phosphotransferase n=1 Tax=Nocardioides sp. B-3 TaxID=2895565 RepID=UPI00300DEACC